MKKIFLLILLFQFTLATAQTNELQTAFQSAIQHIEENSASLVDRRSAQPKAYRRHLRQSQQLAQKARTEKEVLGAISHYLAFAQDNHQGIAALPSALGFTTVKDTAAVVAYYQKNVEQKKIDTSVTPEGLLGRWYYPKENAWIHIQPDLHKPRTHVGLLTDVHLPYAQEGFVKLEIFRAPTGQLIATFWDLLYLKPQSHFLIIQDDVLQIGNLRLYRNPKAHDSFSNSALHHQVLNATTHLITLPDFDYSQKAAIDSLITAQTNALRQYPNLILDLRSNTGGADYSYYGLIPWVMSEKENQFPIAHALFLSPRNLRQFTERLREREQTAQADSLDLAWRKHLHQFQKDTDHRTFSLTEIEPNPQRIILLVDEKNASSAEGFIALARQSKKVLVAGVRTAGAVNYGNVDYFEIPKSQLEVRTTQSKVTFSGTPIQEFEGVIPDIDLSAYPKDQWIEQLTNNYFN